MEGGLARLKDVVLDRFRRQCLFRVLQADRQINVQTLLESMNGTDKLRMSFAGMIGTYNNKFLSGEEGAGRDRHGRPYKNWILTDPAGARQRLESYKIRPMPPEGLAVIQQRRERIRAYLAGSG